MTRFAACNKCCKRWIVGLSTNARRAMTLVEVIAGIALLGTVLAVTVLSHGRLLRQHQRAQTKLQAVAAVDQLLSQWYANGEAVPVEASGKWPGSPVVVWKTQRGRTQTSGAISVDVVELTAKIEGESPSLPPLVRIELALSPREQP